MTVKTNERLVVWWSVVSVQ